MYFVVLDTETGDKRIPSQVLQIAYVVVDSKDFSVVKAVNKYIKYPVYHITPEAAKINGLSETFLNEYGEEATLVADELYSDLRQSSVCGYNIRFDIGCLTNFFMLNGYPTFSFATSRDCKIHREKLVVAAQRHMIVDSLVRYLTAKYFGNTFNRPHDATFDVIQTMLLAKKLRKELNFENE